MEFWELPDDQKQQHRKFRGRNVQARSRRKSRPRKDVYAISTTSKSSSSTFTAITTITSAITSSSATALKKLEALTAVSEPKSSVCKPERSPLTDSHHLPKLKDKEEIQEDEEETEVDVVEVEAEVEMEVEVRAVIGIGAEAEVAAQPRDKIRKSDTIWSPWK